MRKISYFLALTLVASQAFATYIVVLKNGTRYRARSRWTVSAGKAIVQLESGTTIQLDPNLIDVARSDELNSSGLGDSKVIARPNTGSQTPTRAPQPSLGEITRLRRQQQEQQAAQGTTLPPGSQTQASPVTPVPANRAGMLGNDVISKFASAYDNVGFYDAKITPSAPYALRVNLTADNEDQVFKAISATSYVMMRIPKLTGARIDLVELFMATTNGGTAGRFHMSQDDAGAIDAKKMSLETYFVRKVLF
jgi:hypothetical protein